MHMFDVDSLYASLGWGAVGAFLVTYGKKQSRAGAIVGGLSLVTATFFVTTPLILTIIGVIIVAGSWTAMRQGY